MTEDTAAPSPAPKSPVKWIILFAAVILIAAGVLLAVYGKGFIYKPTVAKAPAPAPANSSQPSAVPDLSATVFGNQPPAGIGGQAPPVSGGQPSAVPGAPTAATPPAPGAQMPANVAPPGEAATSAHWVQKITIFSPEGNSQHDEMEGWYKLPDKTRVENAHIVGVFNGSKQLVYNKDINEYQQKDIPPEKFTDVMFTPLTLIEPLKQMGVDVTTKNIKAKFKGTEYPAVEIKTKEVTLKNGEKLGKWHIIAYLANEKRGYMRAAETVISYPDGKLMQKSVVEFDYAPLKDDFFNYKLPKGAKEAKPEDIKKEMPPPNAEPEKKEEAPPKPEP